MQSQIVKTGPLETTGLVRQLIADGVIDAGSAKRLRMSPPRNGDKIQHVLNYIAGEQLPDLSRQGRVLSIDNLLDWLAGHCGQTAMRIDPLKNRCASCHRSHVLCLCSAPSYFGGGR